jgi:hypothetical protein
MKSSITYLLELICPALIGKQLTLHIIEMSTSLKQTLLDFLENR